MRNARISAGRLVPLALGCAGLLAGLGSYGTSARAQAVKPDPEQQLSELRQQVAALAHRVTELEKTKGGGAINQGSAKGSEGKAPGVQGEKPSPPITTVRAPFVVQNENGKTIFSVDAVPGDNRAIVEIGDLKGARVHLGPNSGGGASIALFDHTNTPGVYLTNTPTKNYVSVVRGQRAASSWRTTRSAQ